MVKRLLPLALLIFLAALLIWMPWITEKKAAEIAGQVFVVQQQDVVDGCGFNCAGCGVIAIQRIYSGYIVEIEYACGMLFTDKPEYHQRGVVFVSPFGTAQLMGHDNTVLSAAAQIPLARTEWLLLTMNGQSLLDATYITLEFDEAYAGGYTGCNYYGGRYQQAEREGLLSFEEVASTAQNCPTPPGIMEQEKRYLDAFYHTSSYRTVDARLELAKLSGEVHLVYQQKLEYPMNPADLERTRWQLISLNGVRVTSDVNITMIFSSDNELEGTAACRGYIARYEAEGDDLSFPFLSMQGESCASDTELARLESEFIDILDRIINYKLSEMQLELVSVRNELLVFEPLKTTQE